MSMKRLNIESGRIMIYVSTTIEPENGDEFEIMSISTMRRTNEINEVGEYKYTYSGWWKDREGNRNFIKHSFIWSERENSIFDLVGKICLDIETKRSCT